MTVSKKKVFVIAGVLIAILVLVFALISCAPANTTDEQKQDVTTEETPAATEAEEPEAKDEQKKPETTKATESSKSNSDSKASSSSSSNKTTSSSSSASSSSSSSKAEATHTHSWVKHDAVYDTEPVYEKRVVCSCGKQFATQDAWSEHNQSLGFGNTHSYSYKSVQVDTKKVLVEETYYTCSCGATK